MIPEFSVVVPSCKQPNHLLKCLDALSRQKLPHYQFEIIVVDDANDRATEATVRNFTQVFGIEARYLSQPKRMGLAAARNRGWQAARGRIVAFTDDDCQPQPAWLTSAYTCFKRGAQVVSGQLRIPLVNRPTPYEHAPLFTESTDFTAANCFCLRSAIDRAGGF
ncbi:MAG: glycosyltransferase [Rudanella sp.]|nr:glycosyltransferase [Rudanella sp.]